ncbi:MAG: Ig-like domain-containing protein [Thermoplasmata archaeon]|nr:MAG: Ig-like domain-containing protein [Thermoplasmata archaeon]
MKSSRKLMISSIFVTLLLVQPLAILIIPIEPVAGPVDSLEVDNIEINMQIKSPSIRSSRLSADVIDFNRSTAGPYPNATIYGNSSGLAGYSLAAGDVNSDGIDDLVIGAPTQTCNGSSEVGSVFVLFGSELGKNLSAEQNLKTSANLTINGTDAGDKAGSDVEVGDVNGDGIVDIIIGAPEADGKNNDLISSGEVYVIYGRKIFPDIIQLNKSITGDHQNITIYGNDSYDRFGLEILSADLIGNNPAFIDIAVSATEADGPDNNRSNAGEVVIISGSSSLPSEISIDTSSSGKMRAGGQSVAIYGSAANQQLGHTLAAGELCSEDSDKVELLVNSYGRGPGGSGRSGCGEVYIFNGRSLWPAEIDLAVNQSNITIYGQSSGDYAGFSISVDNINFDNCNDIILGAPYADGKKIERIDAGEVYIIYGNGSMKGSIDLDPQNGAGPDVTIYAEGYGSNKDMLGYNIGTGDYDYDDQSDIFISATFGKRYDNGIKSGKIYQVSTYYPLPVELDLRTNSSITHVLQGADILDEAGFEIITCNLDGRNADDTVISAPYADGYANDVNASGEIYINYGIREPRPDTRGPLVISTLPLNGSSNVPLDESIVLYFDEPVVPSSFRFRSVPDPGNWQAVWNATNEKVTLAHNNFTEVLWHQFDILQVNDTLNNPFNNSYWNSLIFITGDFTPPVIVNTVPENSESNVSIYKNITVTFSEEINSASLSYNCTPDPGGWLNPEWDPTGTIVTLQHSNPFQELQEYTIEILTANDAMGNPLGIDLLPLKWKFTTGKKDPIMPKVLGVYPFDNTTNIETTTYFEIIFSEPMNITTVLNAFKLDPYIPVGDYTWLSFANTLKIQPAWNLLPGTNYTATLGTGALDLNGNGLDGNGNSVPDGSPADDYIWKFKTSSEGDIFPPTVLEIRPSDNENNVKLNLMIEIAFSEVMDKNSVVKAFYVTPIQNGSFYWFNNYLTFIPDNNFLPNTTYHVRINGSAKDSYGNALDGNLNGIPEGLADYFSWSFTTASAGVLDDDVPYVIRTLPAPDAEDVPINTHIEIEFSELMSWTMAGDSLGLTPAIFGQFQWNGSTLIFNPSFDLQINTVYTVKVSALARDLSGKYLKEDYTFSFKTGNRIDMHPPTIISTYPKPDAEEVSRNTEIEITFNEPMMQSSTEAAFNITPTIKGSYFWNDNVMIFKPDTLLESNTKYTVTIKNTARDSAGNYFDGDSNGIAYQNATDDYSFSFTTSQLTDNIPPYILSTFPENGSTEVYLFSSIMINFSEPMNKIYFNDTLQIIPETPGFIVWDENSMVFFPDGLLEPLTTYSVTISFSARDLAGNTLDGNGNGIAEDSIVDSYTFSFKTRNTTYIEFGPKLLKTIPASSEIDVAVNQPIILQFDSPMNTGVEFFVFNCTPNPGGWDLTWSADGRNATLTHNPFNYSADYTFSIIYVQDQNGFPLLESPVPITFSFTTAAPGGEDKEEDDESGIALDKNVFIALLLAVFISILAVLIASFLMLMKLKRKAEGEGEGEEEEEEEGEEEEGEEEEKEGEEELDEVEKEILAELGELPPPPSEEVPTVEAGEELEEMPEPPSEDVPVVDAETEEELEEEKVLEEDSEDAAPSTDSEDEAEVDVKEDVEEEDE